MSHQPAEGVLDRVAKPFTHRITTYTLTVMKSSIISVAALVFAAISTGHLTVNAFFLSPGGLTASSAPLVATTQSTRTGLSGTAHGAACTCSNCKSGIHFSSCKCPSCSSASISARSRSHGARCRCGACSMRMQAHQEGCGCGDCSSRCGATCKCSACVSASHTEVCSCAICAGGRRRVSVTVLGMSGAGTSEGELVSSLRERLLAEPEAVIFEDTMMAVGQAFDYSPKRFVNGETSSDAGVNEGSCKVFSFGHLANLSPEETLACFGEHYRGVVADPAGDSHGNIRAFMKTGWEGVQFPDGVALSWK